MASDEDDGYDKAKGPLGYKPGTGPIGYEPADDQAADIGGLASGTATSFTVITEAGEVELEGNVAAFIEDQLRDDPTEPVTVLFGQHMREKIEDELELE
jgi:hypothetical protein